jgi:predicted small integral membrane protein
VRAWNGTDWTWATIAFVAILLLLVGMAKWGNG